MERRHHHCTVCDSVDNKVLYEPWLTESDPTKLYGAASGIPGTQRIVQCLNCNMIFENPRFDAETIVKGYMSSEDASHDSQYHMRVHSFYQALVKHKKILPPPGSKVLDIGTAGGAFLEAACDFGYDAHGMEPSLDLVSRGKERGLKIEQGTIENHSFELNSFDLVCLWDVIEHLPDPKTSLSIIRNLLKPNATLLINYPDIGTLQAKLAGKHFWWLLSVHLHHFTQTSLTNLFDATGFQTIQFRKYWQTLEFGYLEQMAIHYKIPLTNLIYKLTPNFIRRFRIPYYASQTTALARIK